MKCRRVSGWTADRIPCWVVAWRVFCAMSSPTFHKRLGVSGVAAECRVVVSTIFIFMLLYWGCRAAIHGTVCRLSLDWEYRGAIPSTPCRSVMLLYWGCQAAIHGTACHLSLDWEYRGGHTWHTMSFGVILMGHTWHNICRAV